MTVLPPGLTALPDVPPILDQIEPWPARPTAAPGRSPLWAAAFVALVVLTVAAGASLLRDRSGDPSRPGAPVGANVELVADSAGPATAG